MAVTALAFVPTGAAVPSLARWGMTADGDLVYRTLVTFGGQTRQELAAALGLSRQRVEQALAELTAAGAAVARTDTGRPGRQALAWQARPPADVVHRLRSRRLRVLDPDVQARAQVGLLRVVSRRLGPLGVDVPTAVTGTVADGVRYLPSRAATAARLGELGEAERHTRLVVNTEQAFDAETARRGAAASRAVANRAGLRVLGVPPADGDRFQVGDEHIDQTTFRYREAPAVPLKLFVLDRRVALFPVDPSDYDRGYLEVVQRDVVDALIAVFERAWDSGEDPARFGVPSIVLSEREQALVELLAVGHTDVTAAAALRISARSVTYALRALMDRVGVENRFQLGLALGTARAAAPPALTLPDPPAAAR
jgi:DNA-binding CsgD family transcriptional regulator/DNA-binding transcriptional ArsR family regulator